MQEVTLTILKKDLIEADYMDHDDCPITRALKRAGFPNLRDGGGEIYDSTGPSQHSLNVIRVARRDSTPGYDLLANYVQQYSSSLHNIAVSQQAEESKDFTITLDI